MQVSRYAALTLITFSLAIGRAPLRLKEATQQYRSLTTFQANSAFAALANSSSSSNTAQVWAGTQSNTITIGSASTNSFFQTLATPVNICNDSSFRVSIYFANKANVMNLNALTLAIGNNASNFISFEFGAYFLRDSGMTYPGEWQNVHLLRRLFTQTGSFDCTAVDTVILSTKAQAATVDTFTMGEIASYKGRFGKATMIIHEDDNWLNWITNGVPKLDSMGVKHTIYVNAGRIGLTNFATRAKLDSLYNRGLCDFGNHLWVHDSATFISMDSLNVSLTKNYNYMRDAGWNSPRRLAYPYGRHNIAIDSAMRKWNLIDFARTTKSGNGEGGPLGNNNLAQRTFLAIGNSVDTTTAKTLIDSLVAYKAVGIFLVHEIGAVGCTEDANTWCKDHWLSLMNYVKTKINAGTLQVLSQGQWEESYGGGISPSRRTGIGRR